MQAAAPPKQRQERQGRVQGVFVYRGTRKAQFRTCDTGITGTTDIEVTKGLKESDEIVTGSYKVLRTLRNGTSVKIDNTAPKKDERVLIPVRANLAGRQSATARPDGRSKCRTRTTEEKEHGNCSKIASLAKRHRPPARPA